MVRKILLRQLGGTLSSVRFVFFSSPGALAGGQRFPDLTGQPWSIDLRPLASGACLYLQRGDPEIITHEPVPEHAASLARFVTATFLLLPSGAPVPLPPAPASIRSVGLTPPWFSLRPRHREVTAAGDGLPLPAPYPATGKGGAGRISPVLDPPSGAPSDTATHKNRARREGHGGLPALCCTHLSPRACRGSVFPRQYCFTLADSTFTAQKMYTAKMYTAKKYTFDAHGAGAANRTVGSGFVPPIYNCTDGMVGTSTTRNQRARNRHGYSTQRTTPRPGTVTSRLATTRAARAGGEPLP